MTPTLDSTTPVLDLVINAEAGFVASFTYCEAIPGQPGVPGPPIDITGYTAAMTFRSSFGDGAALTITDTAGIVVGGSDGEFGVSLTAAQVGQLPGYGVYDVLITPPAEQPLRLVQGNFTCAPAVTR